MRKIILSVAILATALSTSVLATEASITSKIKRAQPLSPKTFIIILEEGGSDCQSSNKYFHVAVGENGVTQENLDSMLVDASAAKGMQQDVSISFDSSNEYCYVSSLSLK